MSDRQTIRLLERLSRRMRNIVARGVISLVRDAHKWQSTQLELLDGEVLDDAERAQQYGFSSVPCRSRGCRAVRGGGPLASRGAGRG